MDETNTLQIKIDKAREEMSPLSRETIDAVNWMEVIFSMNTKYNSEQLENLKVETELLLCGLTSTIDFPKELETRMKIPRSEVAILLDQMDKLIFKKMQEKLEEKLNKDNPSNSTVQLSKTSSKIGIPLPPYKVITSDKLPIANKENINTFNTASVIQREENVSDMITNPEVNSASSHSIETDMYREHGVEIIKNEELGIKNKKEEMPIIQRELLEKKSDNNSNIIASKLFNTTTSQKVVTDYSLPIINTKIDSNIPQQNIAPSKPHDPYLEQI